MEFLDPITVTDDELRTKLEEISRETEFSFEFLVQQVRQSTMENKVVVIVDPSHFIELDRRTLDINTHEEIEDFILRWAGTPP